MRFGIKRVGLGMGNVLGCGLLLAAASAKAQTLSNLSVSPKIDAASSAEQFVTPYDNPVITGRYTLGVLPTTAVMRAKSLQSDFQWKYERFDIWGEQSCEADDLLCQPRVQRGELHAWPIQEGEFAANANAAFNFEAHGSLLGQSGGSIGLGQELEDTDVVRLPFSFPRVRTTLVEGTLIVPVNVIVVVPAANMPDERLVMQRYAKPDLIRALFDDVWTTSTFVRAPSGALDILGAWGFRTEQTGTIAGETLPATVLHRMAVDQGAFRGRRWELGFMPDDIFSQCGVQIRLMDIAVVETDDTTLVRREGQCSGGGVFGGENTLRNGLKGLAEGQLDDPSLRTVIFTTRIRPPGTLFARGGEASCPDGVSLPGVTIDNRDSIIALDEIRRYDESGGVPLTLAHEMAHGLGLDHDTSAACGPTGAGNLMCDTVSRVKMHIRGCQRRDGVVLVDAPHNCLPADDLPADDAADVVTCDVMRRNALNAQPDSTPPTLDAGPDQVIECTSPTGASATLTGIAEDPESGVGDIIWRANGVVLGSGSTVVAAFGFGDNVAGASVASGAGGLPVHDTVAIKVQDTVGPAIPALANVVGTACDTSGAFTLAVPAATDPCSTTVTVNGKVIQTDGVPLAAPVAVSATGQVSLLPGLHVVQWSATDEHGNVTTATQSLLLAACMSAINGMNLGDRTRLESPSGAPVNLTNFGEAVLNVGVEARVGSIVSQGPVFLRERARVDGSVTTARYVQRQNQVIVTGTVTEFATLALPPPLSITTPWPTSNQGPVNLEPDQQQSLAPGSFTSVAVKSRSTLTLASGTYFFTSIAMEPQAILKVNGPVTIEVRDNATFRGSVVGQTNAPAPVALRYRGTATLGLETGWYGSVLAPNAAAIIGGYQNATLRGQILAHTIELRPDVIVTAENPPSGGLFQTLSLPTAFKFKGEDKDEAQAELALTSCSVGHGSASLPGVAAGLLMALGMLLRRRSGGRLVKTLS